MCKKIVSVLLCVLMVISLLFTPIYASEKSQISNQGIYESDDFYLDFNIDSNSDVNENCIPFEPVTIEIPVPKSNAPGLSTLDYELETFVLHGGLKKYKSGTFTWYFNIDCTSSAIFKPDITVKLNLQASFTTQGGTYSTLVSCSQSIDSLIDYSKDWTFTTPAKTGYYRYNYAIVLPTDIYHPIYKTLNPVLYNRTGHKWTFSFSDIGKSLRKPRADYVKGQIYARDPSLPGSYYKKYEEVIGKKLDTSLYDVHHVIPLAYGGDNSYSNLIHLPKALHSQITGWFNGY